jgi:hypothetical protein
MLQGIYSICFQSSLATVGEGIVVFDNCGIHGAGEGHIYRGHQRQDNGTLLLDIEVEHFSGPKFPAFGPLTMLRTTLLVTEITPEGFKASGTLVEAMSIKVNVVGEKMGGLLPPCSTPGTKS